MNVCTYVRIHIYIYVCMHTRVCMYIYAGDEHVEVWCSVLQRVAV